MSEETKTEQVEIEGGDKFTRRARPAIVYTGLIAILVNHVVVPIANRVVEWVAVFQGIRPEMFEKLPEIDLPTEFWLAWTSVVSIYVVGRSAEKKGITNRLLSVVTGSIAKK